MQKNLLTATCLLLLSFPCAAELITWRISSAITSITPDLVGYADIGDVITLNYTFESDATDVEPGIEERGKYDGAIQSADVYLNADHAHIEEVGYITILNDYSNGEDVYSAHSIGTATISPSLPSYNGFNFNGFSVYFSDRDATMFSDTSLPIDPDFTGFDDFNIGLNFRKPVSPIWGYGAGILAEDLVSIERIASVPIPPSLYLLFSGLLTLIGLVKPHGPVLLVST